MFEGWKSKGIKPMIYINPYMADLSEQVPDLSRNLFKEASENGYLIMNQDGSPKLSQSLSITFGTIDLTNPKAYEWYK